MTNQDTATLELARHFNGIEYNTINPVNISAVKVMLLDYIGVALRGSITKSGKLAAELAYQNSGKSEATVIGGDHRVLAHSAALANAIAAHSIELDDVDKEALFHFGPPVISAALAAGESVGCSGQKLITAIVCGCEMMERISWATNPALRNRGFHTTAVAGVFGAVTAAAKLYNLGVPQIVSALGLAGAQASGLMEMYGSSMQKRFNAGPPARNGIMAAQLAKLGFTGAETILDGERGFIKAYAGVGELDALRPQTGSAYLLEVEFKRYACARPIHPAVEAAITLRPQAYQRLSSIKTVKVYRHPMWAHYHTNSNPASFHEAQVSLPYSVAVALFDGDAFIDQYVNAEEKIQEITDLMGKVEIISENNLPTTQACRVEIIWPEGDLLTCQVDYPKGSSQNPMTDQEQEGKFRKLAGIILPDEKIDLITGLTKDIDRLDNIKILTDNLIRKGNINEPYC